MDKFLDLTGLTEYDQSIKNYVDSKSSGNSFGNIAVDSTTISADSATDTLTIEAGDNITITPDETNNKITISSSGGTSYTLPVATSSALGGVKSGTDITVDSSGNVNVNDDSHNHVISNVDGLQSALDGKASNSHTHNYAGSSSAGGSANTALGLSPFTISNIDELDSFLSGNAVMKYAKASNCNIGFVSNDGLVISLPWSSTYGAQIAIDDQSNWMGIRTKNKGTWNSWSKIALVSDIPTSLPASDVYSWAKATSKPSYSWDEITSKPSTFTPASHTHNYAGSSSAGGSATSAVKLDSSAGSATQPVYFSSGKPVATTYTLGTSVPSGAVFTDTKNTAGSTNTSSKIFLVGATSQATNPQTYSHDTAYVGTDGCLYSNSTRVVSEIVSSTEPTNQKNGDYWLQDYE